jgi:protein SCO1/2
MNALARNPWWRWCAVLAFALSPVPPALAKAVPAAPAAGDAPGARGFAGSVDFVQHLDAALPTEVQFRDERGTAVRLGDYLGAGPLGLVFAYFGCTNLCPTQVRNLAQRLAQSTAVGAGKAQVLVVSVDPLDSPVLADRAKHRFLDNLLTPEQAARWHFLSGTPADIAPLTQALGFGYRYDPASRQYAHPAGTVLITPQGRVARYFFGFDFTADELGRALDQAAARRIGSPIERLLLICFHYDLANGPYSALILRTLRALALGALAGALGFAWIRLGRARRAPPSAVGP